MRERMHGFRGLGAVAIACAALVAAGCGSSSDDKGDGGAGATTAGTTAASDSQSLAEAKAIVAKATAIPTFSLDAPVVDAAKAKGKKIFAIPSASANAFAASIDAELKNVAEKLGMGYTEFTNSGSPASWAQGVEQAISAKADVIVLTGGSDPAVLMPQLKRAKAAGIEVVTSHYYQSGQVPKSVDALGVANVMGTFNAAGTLLVQYAFSKLGEEVHPLIITAKEAAPSDGMVATMQTELKRLCPGCKSEVLNVPIADWATKMKSAVASALAANPDINYILPLYDTMSINAAAGVMAANKAGKAPIASYNGTPAVLKMIQDGDLVVADAGESISWIAYATMDQALRLLTGMKPLPNTDNNEDLPLRVFDDGNVAEAGTPPDASKGYGDAYAAGYEKLWGLQ